MCKQWYRIYKYHKFTRPELAARVVQRLFVLCEPRRRAVPRAVDQPGAPLRAGTHAGALYGRGPLLASLSCDKLDLSDDGLPHEANGGMSRWELGTQR